MVVLEVETVGEAVSTTSHRVRLDVQGLRGISVLLVVLYHAGAVLPGGFIGVDVFFVISGYVITSSLCREWVETGSVGFRSFFARRVRRLLPALAAVTLVTTVASVFLLSPNGPQQEVAKTALGASTFVANFVIFRCIGDYFSPTAEHNPLLHIWSLSVEEQFFLVFPVVLALGWWIGARRWGPSSSALWLVGLVAAASFGLSLGMSYGGVRVPVLGGDPKNFAFYASFTRAWEFAVGSVPALAPVISRRVEGGLATAMRAGGLLAIAVGSVAISDDTTFPGLAALVPVLGAVAVVIANSESGFLGNRILVWLGDLSYSWYLWHWPLVVLTRQHFGSEWVLAASVVALVPAWYSYRHLEVPIRRSPRFRGRATVALFMACLSVPLLATGVLAMGARGGWGLDWPIGAHKVVRAGCDHGSFEPDRCRWSTVGDEGLVLLTGDSQSWGVADGLIAVAEEFGRSTVVGTLNGCPSIRLLDTPGEGRVAAECARFQADVQEFALGERPDLVVLANWSPGYVGESELSRENWSAGIRSMIDPIQDLGVPVLIVLSHPAGDSTSADRTLVSGQSDDRWTDRGEQVRLLESGHEIGYQVASEYDLVEVFDPFPSLCDEGRCWTARDGTEWYTDENHLSVAGSLVLVERLRQVMAALLTG